jgi:hypothetical protein
MLPTNWHALVALFLWISPHLLLGVLAVVLCKRGLYRNFPCFFAYVLYEIAQFVLMFTLYFNPSVSAHQYALAYYATLTLSLILRFGVIDEVSRDLFRQSTLLKVSARRSLQCVTGFLLVLGILLAVYAPAENSAKWIAGMSSINRGAALVQCGLLLSLLFFSRLLGLSWRRATFGIALGLGILTSVDLAIRAVFSEFVTGVGSPYMDVLITGTYLACVFVWIGYSLVPEIKPESIAVLPRVEVETWNTELQHLLRD